MPSCAKPSRFLSRTRSEPSLQSVPGQYGFTPAPSTFNPQPDLGLLTPLLVQNISVTHFRHLYPLYMVVGCVEQSKTLPWYVNKLTNMHSDQWKTDLGWYHHSKNDWCLLFKTIKNLLRYSCSVNL